ncbi:unnamed protein product [Caenorhabditis brenneri]
MLMESHGKLVDIPCSQSTTKTDHTAQSRKLILSNTRVRNLFPVYAEYHQEIGRHVIHAENRVTHQIEEFVYEPEENNGETKTQSTPIHHHRLQQAGLCDPERKTVIIPEKNISLPRSMNNILDGMI